LPARGIPAHTPRSQRTRWDYEELVGEPLVVLALITVDAIDRAYRHAGGIHTIAAQPRDDPRHGFSFLQTGPGIPLLKVAGFLIFDFVSRYPEAYRAIARLYAEGRLKWRTHQIDGLENAADAVRLLYRGGNNGKLLVAVK
jgi:hypothetical protein